MKCLQREGECTEAGVIVLGATGNTKNRRDLDVTCGRKVGEMKCPTL